MEKKELAAIRKRFGARVRELRSKKGLSQEAFAELCELHRTYIGAVERGERNVSLDNISKISHALTVATADLFS